MRKYIVLLSTGTSCDTTHIRNRIEEEEYASLDDLKNVIASEDVNLRFRILTLEEFIKEFNNEDLNPDDWFMTHVSVCPYAKSLTFNGRCFKDEKAFKSRTGVCYIAEMSNKEYTYTDFIGIAAKGIEDYDPENKHGYTPGSLAAELFYGCDWQHPESLLIETFNES